MQHENTFFFDRWKTMSDMFLKNHIKSWWTSHSFDTNCLNQSGNAAVPKSF